MKDCSPHPPPRDPPIEACGEELVTTVDFSPHAPAPTAGDAVADRRRGGRLGPGTGLLTGGANKTTPADPPGAVNG